MPEYPRGENIKVFNEIKAGERVRFAHPETKQATWGIAVSPVEDGILNVNIDTDNMGRKIEPPVTIKITEQNFLNLEEKMSIDQAAEDGERV